MSDLIILQGEDCLDYINKPIGFADTWAGASNHTIISEYKNFEINIKKDSSYYGLRFYEDFSLVLHKIPHDINKRIIGLVTNRYEDGGLRVAILGNETIDCGSNSPYTRLNQTLYVRGTCKYDYSVTEQINKKSGSFLATPEYSTHYPQENTSSTVLITEDVIPFDDAIDYTPQFPDPQTVSIAYSDLRLKYRGNSIESTTSFNITNNKNNTLTFGEDAIIGGLLRFDPELLYNPLNLVAGALYTFANNKVIEFYSLCPASITDEFFYTYDVEYGIPLDSSNGVCIPFNLLLTENENYALNYIENGTLPPDAFLYPLEWNNLPRYDEPIPTGDKPDDYPDDNDPDDDDRDFDPTPTETPSFTVNQLTNYNWYWLTVPEWSAFISWFWNDIGDYSDFDDIIAKVKGLYNDVASAVIMCRYYPVDISWIGGLGTQSNIKLGMIEKAGAVDTISQTTSLHAVDIGHVHIGTKYKSFMDMSPYSQLSLYLPWHGFIDLDMNLFNGHDVYVKALYDYLSGTIQYYIYYDNELLVNTILCKMAMDIPITLQTKNDRDSAIFNNVSSTIGGLVGAGVGIASGNPIGMTLGVTQGVGAFNSANASAPMRLMGNVGESGAYIGCQNCFVVVRRPTIQPSDGNISTMKGLTTWKKNVGMLCGYGYTLSDLSGQGFTVCHSPRIDFTSTTPLQTEVDEIYSYLEKGVIL